MNLARSDMPGNSARGPGDHMRKSSQGHLGLRVDGSDRGILRW